MRKLLLLALLIGGRATAGDVEGDVPEVVLDDPADELRAAREAYVLGDVDGARARFVALAQRARVRGDVPRHVVADAWVYLGEIQLLGGDRRAADASFRLALAEAPDLRLSPVEHPENIIGAFEVARTAMLAAADAPDRRPRPLPWWGYAPFGVPQFKQGHPVRGVVYATLQLGAAAASVAAWFVVDDAVRRIPVNPPHSEEAAANAARDHAVLLRDAFSTTSAVAFYVTWAVSVTDGGLTWRKAAIPTTIGIAPQPGGAQVRIGWRF